MSVRNTELADFLRLRRRRVSRSELGLQKTQRRRFSWPTREEIALAADVGITWYTWLEQGRPIKMACDTLNRVAAALRMDASETEYLFRLARAHPRPVPTAKRLVPESVRALVESYTAGHALVIDALWNVLVMNRRAEHLFGVGTADGLQRNILWLMFAREDLKSDLMEWRAVARRTVAALRAERPDYASAPFDELIDALYGAYSEFVALWSDFDVLLPQYWTLGPIRDGHTGEGLNFQTVTLPVPDSRGLLLILHFPSSN